MDAKLKGPTSITRKIPMCIDSPATMNSFLNRIRLNRLRSLPGLSGVLSKWSAASNRTEKHSKNQVTSVAIFVVKANGASHSIENLAQVGCCKMYQSALISPKGIQWELSFCHPVEEYMSNN